MFARLQFRYAGYSDAQQFARARSAYQACANLLFGLLLIAGLLPIWAQELPTAASAPRHAAESLPYAPPNLKLIAPPAMAPVPAEIIVHGSRQEKNVALTFDACSTRLPSHFDERVTQVLVDTNTPATIFLGGKWMEDEPEHTKYLASLPQFELGNHTFLHPHLPQVSEARMRAELRWTQEIMYTLTGRQARLFRPPYGEYNDRVVRVASAMGLTTVEFDLASGDPDAQISKARLVKYVTSSAKNGSIIVMHLNQRGWHTAEALPEIIATLRTRGFKLVTVGELIQDTHPEASAKKRYGTDMGK